MMFDYLLLFLFGLFIVFVVSGWWFSCLLWFAFYCFCLVFVVLFMLFGLIGCVLLFAFSLFVGWVFGVWLYCNSVVIMMMNV